MNLKDCPGVPGLPKDHIDNGPCIGRCRRGCGKQKATPKTPEELSAIRKRAWETRREKYGKDGHR